MNDSGIQIVDMDPYREGRNAHDRMGTVNYGLRLSARLAEVVAPQCHGMDRGNIGRHPISWRDRMEIFVRTVGASVWLQIALIIVAVRVVAWLIGVVWRRGRG